MLKKNDLVKQFEILSKQEILNHNDQILASNLSINKIREDIQKKDTDQAKINGGLSSEIGKINVHLKELSSVLGTLVGKLSSLTGELNRSLEDIQSQSTLTTKSVLECKAALQEQEKCSKDDKIKLKYLEESIINIPITLHAFSERIEKKSMQEAYKIKEEILNRPSEAKLVREDLIKMIERDRIDFDGVTKELLAVKKAHFINDKKIENIYTLIERLNKKVEAK
jgi:hypothetical protein